jgi:histidinol-phosphate/aromatic aminotransferase/cobyric acid decarboxylase-like protein
MQWLLEEHLPSLSLAAHAETIAIMDSSQPPYEGNTAWREAAIAVYNRRLADETIARQREIAKSVTDHMDTLDSSNRRLSSVGHLVAFVGVLVAVVDVVVAVLK